MTSKLRILSLALISIPLLAPANLVGAPIPQGNPQEATPANRPAQVQVVLAPAPVQTGKLPLQEPPPADARKPDLILRVGHSQPIEALAFSADGKWLLVPVEKRAANATETAIGFYDAETGKSLRTIPTKWDFVSAVVPTKDGRLIAAGTVGADDDDDPSGSVQIFDLASGKAQ